MYQARFLKHVVNALAELAVLSVAVEDTPY
jgi:hypothetical protein